MKYPYRAGSPSKPREDWLGYKTEEAASAHADTMNDLLEVYPVGIWNTQHWESKPNEWIVEKVLDI